MDNFSNFPTTPISPARSAISVTPSDGSDLPHVSRALYVGQGGDISVEMADGDLTIFESVPNGTILPVRVKQIRSTATTASGIISLW